MGRKLKRLRNQVRRLEELDQFRRLELADRDAVLTRTETRERKKDEFALALADRVFRQHELLRKRAEGRQVVITETDYPLE